MFELYIFGQKFCDAENYEGNKIDTDTLFLALSVKTLEGTTPPKENEKSGTRFVPEIEQTVFLSTDQTNSFPRSAAIDTRNTIGGYSVSLTKKLDMQKCCFCAAKNFFAVIEIAKVQIHSKSLNKRTWKDCGDEPISKYREVFDEYANVSSIDRKFWKVKQLNIVRPFMNKKEWIISFLL